MLHSYVSTLGYAARNIYAYDGEEEGKIEPMKNHGKIMGMEKRMNLSWVMERKHLVK